MANALVGASVATAGLAIQDYSRAKPERDARLAEAKARQRKAELELGNYESNTDVRAAAREKRLIELESQTQTLWRDKLAGDSYRAFDSYENGTGNVASLNTFLQDARKNPVGSKMFGNIARVDTITGSDPELDSTLYQMGYNKEAREFISEVPEFRQEFLRAVSTGGETHVIPLETLYNTTRYRDYADTRALAMSKERQEYLKLLNGQENADTRLIRRIAEEEGIGFFEATAKYFKVKNTGKGGSTFERMINTVMEEATANGLTMTNEEAAIEANRRIKSLGSETAQRAANKVAAEKPGASDNLKEIVATQDQLEAEKARTSAMKNNEAVDTEYKTLDSLGGGDFNKANLDDPATRATAAKAVANIENLTKSSMTTADKHMISELSSLIKLGGVAGSNLTAADTGPIDSLLHEVKAYVSDNVEGIEARAAYSTFANDLRNALMGATLTPSEQALFTKSAGSLSQQAGPVLQKLSVQVENIKNKLETIKNLNNPYIAKFYLGKELGDADKIIAALDQRLQAYKTVQASSRISAAPVGQTAIKPRKTLDEIYNETHGGAK